MQLDVKRIESGGATELYICATPRAKGDDPQESMRMFQAVADVIRDSGARACRERVFVPDGRLRTFHKARRAAYGDMEAPAPDWLMAGAHGPVGGIQVHAIRGARDWRPLRGDGEQTLGWSFSAGGYRWAVTGGLCTSSIKGAPAQARAAFEAAEGLLQQAEMDLSCIARTWLFMEDILSWYPEFNRVRNNFFVSRGLLQRHAAGNGAAEGDASRVPASTGMGVTPVLPARLSLEMFAAAGEQPCIKRFSAAGRQRCAYEYGSAFARASEARTPAGRTIFVSGTAAIDEYGATCFAGNPRGQIRMTIDNVMAVLRDAHCAPGSIVQAIAYCKTPRVAELFRREWMQQVPWPWVIVIGDVCRDDLLFEAEVTACEPLGNN